MRSLPLVKHKLNVPETQQTELQVQQAGVFLAHYLSLQNKAKLSEVVQSLFQVSLPKQTEIQVEHAAVFLVHFLLPLKHKFKVPKVQPLF